MCVSGETIKPSVERFGNHSDNRSAKSGDTTYKHLPINHEDRKKPQWLQYQVQNDSLGLENRCLKAELTAV